MQIGIGIQLAMASAAAGGGGVLPPVAGTLSNPPLSARLGILNVNGPRQFVNQFKQASLWEGRGDGGVYRNWDQLLALGAISKTGQINFMQPDQYAIESFMLMSMREGHGASGRWRFTWHGAGDLSVRWGENIDASVPNQIDFDYVAGNGNQVLLGVSSVTSGPLRNFKLVHHDDLAADAAGEIFRPVWRDEIRNYRALRFDTWAGADGPGADRHEVNTWASRASVDDEIYHRFVPIEVMIRLCHEVGADAWFCLPYTVADDYVTGHAQLARDTMPAHLNVYAEWATKAWDFPTGPAVYCSQQGQILFGSNTGEEYVNYYGGRSSQVAQLWRRVYGASPRLKTVVQTQTDYQGLEYYILLAPMWTSLPPEKRLPGFEYDEPYHHFDCYAVHGQIDGDMAYGAHDDVILDWAALPRTEGFNRFRDQMLTGAHVTTPGRTVANIRTRWNYQKNAADTHGLEMICYEGGSHMNMVSASASNPDFLSFVHDYHASAQFGQVVTALYTNWREVAGSNLFAYSTDCRVPDSNTCNGIQRWPGDHNPAWQALDAINRLNNGPAGRGDADFVGTKKVSSSPLAIITVSNGVISPFSRDGVDYVEILFSQSGAFSVDRDVEWHNRALGGGGGSGGYSSSNTVYISGGGGAGGLRQTLGQLLAQGTYNVTIGQGAPQQTSAGGANGQDSILVTPGGPETASGGGFGASHNTGFVSGSNGGSGGGGRGSSGGVITPGTGVSGQGNSGGSGFVSGTPLPSETLAAAVVRVAPVAPPHPARRARQGRASVLRGWQSPERFAAAVRASHPASMQRRRMKPLETARKARCFRRSDGAAMGSCLSSCAPTKRMW